MDAFRVLQIDHVELFVPDRHEAAAWYQRVLGLEIVSEFQPWASNPRGPLMISSAEGSTKLALFEGQPQASRETAGFHLVAFRVEGNGFVEFVQRLKELHLEDQSAQPVTADSVVDHQKAYSIYFRDPYGHHLEVTTYDYEDTRAALAEITKPLG